MRTLLISILALLASPALALPLTRDMPAEIDANTWQEPVTLDDYLFDAVGTDEQSFHFEGAMLADVQAELGGTLQENYDHRWLCYETAGLRIHFVGDWLEFDAPSPLELVTIERVDEGNADCPAKPELAGLLANGDLPGIGATVGDLMARFGSAEIGADGRLAYRNVAILGDEESWTQIKTIYYRLADGVVDQVGFRRETRTNPYLAGWAVDNYRLRAPDAVDQELDHRITGPFTAGDLELTLGTSVLDDVVNAFGGEIRSEGEAGGHMLWLCYLSDGPQGKLRTWFVSDGEMGGPEHRLTAVAVDPIDVEDEWSHGCIDAPAGFAIPAFDLPGIGATLAELEASFGVIAPDSRGHLYYDGNTPLGDGSAMIVYQSLSYRTANGVVTGLAIDQEIVD